MGQKRDSFRSRSANDLGDRLRQVDGSDLVEIERPQGVGKVNAAASVKQPDVEAKP